MYFNTARDHCTDSVALACIVNVFTACKTLLFFWDRAYGLQRFYFSPLSKHESFISVFIESTVEVSLCCFSLKTYKM